MITVPSFVLLWLMVVTICCYVSAIQQNYCQEMAQLQNTSSPFDSINSLAGRTVKVGINLDADPAMMYLPQGSYHPNNGLLYKLEQEIAKRGQFKLEYVLVPSLSSYASTDQFLNEVGNSCDIYGAGVVTDTSNRRAAGIDFSVGVVDNSIILVTTTAIGRSNSIWAFATPFDQNLWILIYMIAIFHAVVFYICEKTKGFESSGDDPNPPVLAGKNDNDDGPPISLTFAIYDSLLMSGEPEPTTGASGILKISFSIFLLIIIASYGANLANIYISAQVPSIPVVSISDANDQAAPICTLVGTDPTTCFDCSPGSGTPYAYVNATYPLVQLYQVYSNDPGDLLTFINNATCVGAIMTMNQWKTVQNFASANTNCNIIPMPKGMLGGSPLMSYLTPNSEIVKFVGAFAYNVDYSILCTSLVGYVWSAILTTMVEDGTYDAIYDLYIQQARTTTNCSAVLASKGPIPLGLQDTWGIFIILGIGLFAGVITAVASPLLWGTNGILKDCNPVTVRAKRYALRRQQKAMQRPATTVSTADAISS